MFNKIKGWFNNVINKNNIKESLDIEVAVSDKMDTEIRRWENMYTNRASYLNTNPPLRSLNIPNTIVVEKTRLALIEFKSVISNEGEPTERTEYLNEQYQHLLDNFRYGIEKGIALGSCVVKPIFDSINKRFSFQFVGAESFFPVSFDSRDCLTDVIFAEEYKTKHDVYTRLERHTFDKGIITVENQLFKGTTFNIGQKVSLKEIPIWSELEPKVVIKSNNATPLTGLLVTMFRYPCSNIIDKNSKLGVSCFNSAIELIEDVDKMYSSMLWEFKGSELAVMVDADAFKFNDDKQLASNQDRLFKNTGVSTDVDSHIFEVFNPDIRENSYINGINTILKSIEDSVGIARGTLSKTENEAKTATEIKMMKQRTYQSNKELQKEMQRVLTDVVQILDIYVSLYNIAPYSEYSVDFQWDDSIITDVSQELQERINLANIGALNVEEVASWYLNEDLEQRFIGLANYNELKDKYTPVTTEIEEDYYAR